MTDYNLATYLGKVDAWWRTANYIAVPQMYLKNNRFHLAQDAANVVYGADAADFSQKSDRCP
ncbi:hypothetical protein FACS1894193_09780 [Bacilli bacterium]|nr:hypothetical protein FACS1894192_09970 [Bacilli bacterium]GHU43233.1 hypothetical protein FACS1894193_09780 [Bacilli bacterium]